MRAITIAALVLSVIVFAAGCAMIFMIFSPSVQVDPTMALTASVEGIALLSICTALLAIVVLSTKRPE
jgi:hypothetical protein